tara:strand:- start:591 stop:1253 length:663 start_codon:yes stop_codon:yes gene_type:complete
MEPTNKSSFDGRALSDDELNITFYPTMCRALDGKQMPRFSRERLRSSSVSDFVVWLHSMIARFDVFMPFPASCVVEDYANSVAFCRNKEMPFQLRPEHTVSVALISNLGPRHLSPEWHEDLESDYNNSLKSISNTIQNTISEPWSAEDNQATTPSAPGDVRLGDISAGETTAASRDVSAVTSGKQEAEDALLILLRTPAKGRGTPKTRKGHPKDGTPDDA